jgi:hypothetical protein
MVSTQIMHSITYLEALISFAGVTAISVRRQWLQYWSLGFLLGVHGVATLVVSAMIQARALHLLPPGLAYAVYFYAYWTSTALSSVLGLVIICCVFRLAMAPLRGLETLGMLIFRWAGAISIAVALGSALTPHQTGTGYLFAAIAELQRTQSILTLCLLLFVCFAIRPMGLSFRSRIFGVSLGLGLLATNDLVQSAFLAGKPEMSTVTDFVNGTLFCVAALLWTVYFGLPEPKRRLIVLPTTSPLLRWNQISQALGDNPGYVALSGLDSFAPSELEIMRRASGTTVTPFPRSVGA